MQNFSSEDLLLYIYGETSPQQTAEIKTALETDWNLKEKYELLKDAHNELNTIKLKPSATSLNFIMAYAEKALETEITPA